MQKLDYEDAVSCSPTSVSSGYCSSQWMSPNTPNTYGFSKQSASERTISTESEFESDSGVNQKLLREFHWIRPKTQRVRCESTPSGVQEAKKKPACSQQHRKPVHDESEVLKTVLLRLNSTSFPRSHDAVRSSSSDLHRRELIESPLKAYSLNSGHTINSDKFLVPATSSLSKKRSKCPKKCLTSLCPSKVRYLIVSICRLPAGIKSMNVKNIRNSLCWFQSDVQMLDFKIRFKRTENGFRQLQSNTGIIQLQSNSVCKQLQSCSYLKQLQSQSLKQRKSKSDVKYANLSHDKNQLSSSFEKHPQSKCDVKHFKSNKKCKYSSRKAYTEEEDEHHKVTEVEHGYGCDVIHNGRSGFAKGKALESYTYNSEQMQCASLTKTKNQNSLSLCRISDFDKSCKKRSNPEQNSVKVTDTTYDSNDGTVRESPVSHCVSASGFRSTEDRLDSSVSAFSCHSASSSVKHYQKRFDPSEHSIIKNQHVHRKVKRRVTGKIECKCQQCHGRSHSPFHRVHQPTPVRHKHVPPKNCHKQSSICHQKHERSSTNTEAYANEVLTNEADRILSPHKSPCLTDIHTCNNLPRPNSERGIRSDCRNLFDTFLSEISLTSQQNQRYQTKEITPKPEISAIQSTGKHQNDILMLKSDSDLGLLEPSDLSEQLRTENAGTELFEASARLLDTNDDMYSDISDDVLPDAVSTRYDMFSNVSDRVPDDLPGKVSTKGDMITDTGINMLPDHRSLWANDFHRLWLQSQHFSPPTVDMSLELTKTNATEICNAKSKGELLTPEYSSCSDNHEDILDCLKPCPTFIQNSLPACESTCHTEFQTNSSSQRIPCSITVTTISKGPGCFENKTDDSLCKRCCSSGKIPTLEAPFPSNRAGCFSMNQTSEILCSLENTKNSSSCKGPCFFEANQKTVFTSDSVGHFSAESVEKGSSPTSPGAVEESMASDEPCTYKKQRLNSYERPCSNESQDGISPCGVLNSLDLSLKSAKSTSEKLSSAASDENTLNSVAYYSNAVESRNDEQVQEIPCSVESFLVETPFPIEGPVVSVICNSKEGHFISGETYFKEGSLGLDATCFKEGPLTSQGPCCKVGPLVSEVIFEDSCSREGLIISEGPLCKQRPLVSEEPVFCNGSMIADRLHTSEGSPVSDLPYFKEGCLTSETSCSGGFVVSQEILTPEAKCVSHKGSLALKVAGSNMLPLGLTVSQKGFSSVQDVEDLLTAGVSCLNETNDVSLNLEDLFPFVLQETPEGFTDQLNYEDLLSFAMQEGTPVESHFDNTQGNPLIAPTSCIVTFRKDSCKAHIQKGLLASESSDNKESKEPESNEMNELDTSSQSESYLAKFNEFTNVLRPPAACESDGTDHKDDVDSLEEMHNECISDHAKGTSGETVPFMPQVTMPRCHARAKTESWLQEYQSQMLEKQQRTHKNWKLLVSVIDDRGSGRRCGRKRDASGNRPKKRKISPGASKTRQQPKKSCTVTCNSEQTEPEPSEDFTMLQQDFCNVDLTSPSNFSVDGVMANFQNMVLNGDPSTLSMFVDQANTWLSMENPETSVDLASLGHSGLNVHNGVQLTVPLANESLTSVNNTIGITTQQNDLLNSASAVPIQQPESIAPSGLPAVDSYPIMSTDAQTMAMLLESCGNTESLNVSSSDPGNTPQTVVPGFSEVSELDAEMLQLLLSVLPQLGSSGVLPGLSCNESNEVVRNTEVNRGIVYVLNHSNNSFIQLVDCSQILDCVPAQECNKENIGSHCHVESQTSDPALILTNGDHTCAKVNNPTNTQNSDPGVCIAQNSSDGMRPGLSDVDSQPAQNDCPVVDIGEFRVNNTANEASVSNLEQQIDVVESGALLSEKNLDLESQQKGNSTLVLDKNYKISKSCSAPLTENSSSNDQTHQHSAVVLLEKGYGSGTVVPEKGSECSETVQAKRLYLQNRSDSMITSALRNDVSNENNQTQNVLPTGDELLSRQNCDMEQFCQKCRPANGNYADQQSTSRSECTSAADFCENNNAVASSDLNCLSVEEDALSDQSDPFVLTCEDAGDNAAIFLEAAESYCSETSDVIMLGCNDSLQSHQENDSETARFNVATNSPKEQCTSDGNDDATKNHAVSTGILLKSKQSSLEHDNQTSKYFDEGIQKKSEDGNKKSSDVAYGKSSLKGRRKSTVDNEIRVEESNRNCYEDKTSQEAYQALRSGSCEEGVITKVMSSKLAKVNAARDSDLRPDGKPVILHSHGSDLILGGGLTSEVKSKVKTKPKKSKRFHKAAGKESGAIKSQLFSLTARNSIPENTNRLRNKLASTKTNVVEIELRKPKPISKRKRKTSHDVGPSQGLHLTVQDRIVQNMNDDDIGQTISGSGGVTRSSFNRSKEQREKHLNESRVKEIDYSRVQTVLPDEVNCCTNHARTLKPGQNGIKLRIVKVRRGVWQAQSSSTDPVTHQCCSQERISADSAGNDNCVVSSDNNPSSFQNAIYVSDESDTDSQDCFCVDEESCMPDNRLMSAKRTVVNQMASSLPAASLLHRIGCKCVSCAEQQFLYGRDNTMSMLSDISLTRNLMQYKQSMPVNRCPSKL